ncbi:nucleotidyltransferase [Metabacillus sp. RGM 3146]|uniref:nucleotidyltransferase n=1 Tax=Metabacillus sp. RGM 3146 TaxID=3401092 RepID=UPI003B99AA43
MNVLGIVVEYNPFHNGHLLHLQKSKEETGADIVAAVMSGPFLQRGEPALVSKWYRTKMALYGGVDLVIELPYVFASQKAESFASGAVSILDALECTHLSFGSEQGSIEPFLSSYEMISSNKIQYESEIKEQMKQGISYPQALSNAFKNISSQRENLADLTKPNNILGFHYIRAINEQRSSIVPATIMREAAGYHEEKLPYGSIASATGIRKALFSNEGQKSITDYVPESTWDLLNQDSIKTDPFRSWEDFFSLLKYTILTMTKGELADIYEVEEGLENRILSFIKESLTFKQFMEKLKTKRYTWTRLQRMCVHILTRTSKKDMAYVLQQETSRYLRVLGMSKKGQQYLNQKKKKLKLPLITKVSSFHDPMLELDLKASNIYNMVLPEPMRSARLREEYATPPIRFDEEVNRLI